MVKNIIQIKFGIPINVNMSAKIQEKVFEKKGYAWKVATCSFENSKYLGSIFEGLEIICDDIKKTTKGNQTKTTPEKGTPRKFNENNVVWKMKKFLHFTCFYINYLNIYNMFQYLLSHHEMLGKTKIFITI